MIDKEKIEAAHRDLIILQGKTFATFADSCREFTNWAAEYQLTLKYCLEAQMAGGFVLTAKQVEKDGKILTDIFLSNNTDPYKLLSLKVLLDKQVNEALLAHCGMSNTVNETPQEG